MLFENFYFFFNMSSIWHRSAILKIGEISMSIGISNSYALAEKFLRILQGPIFFSFSMLYSPLGNLSFLRCANTKSLTLDYNSILLMSADCFYLLLLSCNYLLTYSWNEYIVLAKYSTFALLISIFPKYLISKIPLGCMPYTIWNGDNLALLLGESLYENSTCGSS